MTALNMLCPDQKIVFNLQTIPVTTTLFDPRIPPPLIVVKLVGGFVNKLNKILKDLPESYEVINDYNNVLNRGFAILKNSDGKIISTLSDAQKSPSLNLKMKDGEMSVVKLAPQR